MYQSQSVTRPSLPFPLSLPHFTPPPSTPLPPPALSSPKAATTPPPLCVPSVALVHIFSCILFVLPLAQPQHTHSSGHSFSVLPFPSAHPRSLPHQHFPHIFFLFSRQTYPTPPPLPQHTFLPPSLCLPSPSATNKPPPKQRHSEGRLVCKNNFCHPIPTTTPHPHPRLLYVCVNLQKYNIPQSSTHPPPPTFLLCPSPAAQAVLSYVI